MTLKIAISHKQTMQVSVFNVFARGIDLIHKELIWDLYDEVSGN